MNLCVQVGATELATTGCADEPMTRGRPAFYFLLHLSTFFQSVENWATISTRNASMGGIEFCLCSSLSECLISVLRIRGTFVQIRIRFYFGADPYP